MITCHVYSLTSVRCNPMQEDQEAEQAAHPTEASYRTNQEVRNGRWTVYHPVNDLELLCS